MNGMRVGAYLHDNGLKGGALVKVLTQTDFASRTDEVYFFANKLAKLAFGAQAESLTEVFEMFPILEVDMEELSKKIGEKIQVEEIRIVK
jgi:translation elongation factor EF-Ts